MNRRVLALILFSCALALPALPVHADATDALFETARYGTASEVKAALSAGADPGARDEHGYTPLHSAALGNDNSSAIRALIEAGADPGARDKYGNTPLHIALAVNDNPSVIAALIEGGADPTARDDDGYTPLHLAAIWNDNPAVITALIEAGADPGARDDAGKTPFDYARWCASASSPPAPWFPPVNSGGLIEAAWQAARHRGGRACFRR